MTDWVNFSLYAVKELVLMLFDWELGLGFSLGDFLLAVAVISIVVSALVLKSAHISRGVDFQIKGGGKDA